MEEKRPSPYERFPRLEYLQDLFQIFEAEQITWIEKSRDLMVSWACVAYLTLNAMRVPHRGVLFQTPKGRQSHPARRVREVPLSPSAAMAAGRLPTHQADATSNRSTRCVFAAGGYVVGIPGGADQMRSYHPWGIPE